MAVGRCFPLTSGNGRSDSGWPPTADALWRPDPRCECCSVSISVRHPRRYNSITVRLGDRESRHVITHCIFRSTLRIRGTSCSWDSAAAGHWGSTSRISRSVGTSVELARAIFTSDDYREWRTLEAAARKAGLLRAWTRQEAVGKALGVGLSLTREQFAAALAGPDRLLVADIHIAESCVAAIATSGPELRPRLTEFLF